MLTTLGARYAATVVPRSALRPVRWYLGTPDPAGPRLDCVPGTQVVLGVQALFTPEFVVEIEATAVLA
jgi:hypothetical protein